MKINLYGPSLLRITLGIVLLAHGLLKLLVFSLAGTAAYFESLGLPGFSAYLVTFGEIGLGLALILGIYSNIAAALSLPILAGATFVHLGNGWLFSNEGGGWEFPALLVIVALVVAIQDNKLLSLAKASN